MKFEPDKFKVIKTPIKNILYDETKKDVLYIINNTVSLTNKIVIHTYNFLKLYILYLYENNLELPLIDKNFILDIFKIITVRKCKKGNTPVENYSTQLKNMYIFYNNTYKNTIFKNEILYYDKLSYILSYEAIDIVKNINNNIKEHLFDHIKKYVNIVFDKKSKIEEIKKINDRELKKEKYKELNKEFNDIYSDLITIRSILSCDLKYHSFFENKEISNFISKNKDKFEDNEFTIEYIKNNFGIKEQIEKIKNSKKELDDDIKKIKADIKKIKTNCDVKKTDIKYSSFFKNEEIISFISKNKDKFKDNKFASEYIKNNFGIKYQIERNKNTKKELDEDIKKIKADIKNFNLEYSSHEKYHIWINTQREILIPNKEIKKSMFYDIEIKTETNKYLNSMIHIAKEIENIKISNEERPIKLFNILPLRTNIVSKHITLDTCGLIQILLDGNKDLYKNYKKENLYEKLWNTYFVLDDPIFYMNRNSRKNKYNECRYNRKRNNKKYDFNYMIKTDGVSVSILFCRLDENGNKIEYKVDFENDNTTEENISYIEKIEITEEIKNNNFVCIDPNYGDLIYCGSEKNKEFKNFRYTQDQRRLETKDKKYHKIRFNIKENKKIEDKSVIEIETELSNYNSKTSNMTDFIDYLYCKNKINYNLFEFYNQEYHRKFKLNRYINTQKSESKMINNFKRIYGDDCNVIFGDYDKGSNNMKGKEPVICKKFRRLFKNNGYNVYLINEFRTSKICNNCHNDELEKFIKRKSKKPKNKEKEIMIHGLLRCNNVKCNVIHNRDKNAVKNMIYIVKHLFETGERPSIFSRKERSES